RLREKNHFRILHLNSSNQPFPEPYRLGMRIVDTKDLHAVLNPKDYRVTQLFHQLTLMLGIEVDRIDVLVLLGRIFGVFDRTVGPMAKPFGMFAHPWMVR